jgi:hypothetical protein
MRLNQPKDIGINTEVCTEGDTYSRAIRPTPNPALGSGTLLEEGPCPAGERTQCLCGCRLIPTISDGGSAELLEREPAWGVDGASDRGVAEHGAGIGVLRGRRPYRSIIVLEASPGLRHFGDSPPAGR